MKKIPKGYVISLVAVALGGALLQYLYRMLPNVGTALISPVNASVWESLKILYWPLLAVAIVYKRRFGSSGGRLAVIPVACLVQYVLSFLWHIALVKPVGFLDAALFVLIAALALAVAPAFGRALEGSALRTPVTLLVGALGLAILLFTFLPPDNVSFADFTALHSGLAIPFTG